MLNFDACPRCHVVLRTGRSKNTRLVLVDTADGLSFFACPHCHTAFNPWHRNRDESRWNAIQPHVERYVPCRFELE